MINDFLSFTDNAVPEINSLLYADDLVFWSTGYDISKLETILNMALVTLSNWSLENDFKGHLRYASSNLDLALPVHKYFSLLVQLSTAALGTIHERYPDQDWLHVFTDGSATAPFGRAGAVSFSNSLNLKEPFSAWSDNFNGFDATSTLPSETSSKRQVTSQGQISPEKNFHSYRPGCWLNLFLSARWQRRAQLSALPRVEGVACFRIITGNDYLQGYLFKISLDDSPLYPLCKSVPKTGEHLSDCPALLHVLSQENCGVLLPARATSASY
ncbi:hydroxysteroid dehydrogenase-like protein 1 [Trichonephila clavipes]|nr:hydroxysteroid dehydrogenase-like protein 1 [Trichonephila clavipes]